MLKPENLIFLFNVPKRTLPLFLLHQDAPVQIQDRPTLPRPRVAHALRPTSASLQRVIGDLRCTKLSTRREDRYRIISSHRTGQPSLAQQQNTQTDAPEDKEETDKEQEKCLGRGEVQVVDLVHEEVDGEDKAAGKVSSALLE